MRIVLNGDPTEIPDGLTIQALLDRLGIDGRMVAVEHNLLIVRRANYASTVIEEHAEVEIVNFVGGG